MSSLHVKMVRSWAGTPERQRRTLEGLGLYKISDERILPDTAATLGMINKLSHLVTYERLAADFKPTGRRHTQGAGARGKKKSS